MISFEDLKNSGLRRSLPGVQARHNLAIALIKDSVAKCHAHRMLRQTQLYQRFVGQKYLICSAIICCEVSTSSRIRLSNRILC